MELVANCIGWAKHLRRKAAAKMHLDAEAEHFFWAQPKRITVACVYGPAGIRAAALPSIFVRPAKSVLSGSAVLKLTSRCSIRACPMQFWTKRGMVVECA